MKKKVLFAIMSLALTAGLLYTDRPVETQAASKGYVTLKGGKASLSKKVIVTYVGSKAIRLGYNIGGKTRGIKGSWRSTDRSVVKVSKYGVCKAIDNGRANIGFTYKTKKGKKTVWCKFKTETKPSSVRLANEYDQTGITSVEAGKKHSFEAVQMPESRALLVNPDIEPTYVQTYKLFSDEACTGTTDLATVDENGVVTAGEYGGTVYLRAEARRNANAGAAVYSNVIKIEIKGLTKAEKEAEDAKKKLLEEEEKKKAKERPSRIEIDPKAPLISLIPVNNWLYAEMKFKLFNGNGVDITNAATTKKEGFSININGANIPVTGNGTATLTLSPATQNLNTVFKVKVVYKEAGMEDIVTESNVTISAPAVINRIEIKGIYKYGFDKTSGRYALYPMMTVDKTYIKSGDKIADFGGHTFVNSVPDSYYLLIKASDSYGNAVSDPGVDETRLRVEIKGTAGLEVDKAIHPLSGQKMIQSVKPIMVEGVNYLTYPIKATEVKKGDVEITVYNGGVRSYLKKFINDGTNLLFFFMQPVTVTNTYPKVGVENVMSFTLTNTLGRTVTKYEEVLSYLGVTAQGNATEAALPFNSSVISSDKYSQFKIRRNANGNADLIYIPNPATLTYNPSNPYMMTGVDNLTLLKGYGSTMERTMSVTVTR